MQRSKHSRNKLTVSIVLMSSMLLSGVMACAQQIQLLTSIKVKPVHQVAVDRLGNFFLIFESGQVKKYDPTGAVVATLKKGDVPELLEPWFHPRIYSYSKKTQRCLIYNHDFEKTDEIIIDPSAAVQPALVCPTNDNKFLIYDEADGSIKKWDASDNHVLSEFMIDTTGLHVEHEKWTFSYLREYQHLIFLVDNQRGILILNELGRLLRKIPGATGNIGFFGEELFYTHEGKLMLFDLFTEKTRSLEVPVEHFMVVTDERIIAVGKDRMMLYKFQPDKPDD